MAGQQFEYDERGSTFYYFIVSFYALVLIPATYYFWPRDKKKGATGDKRCRCVPCERKEEIKKAKEPRKRLHHWIIRLVLLLGWVGFCLLAYKAAHAEFEVHEYDPYAILELDRGASIEEIKKQYRKLSLKHHPDRGGDSKLFVAITKAHQALTDEESKKNWEEYGNPDGPGALRFGIALPSWLVSKEYGFLVLAAYGLVIMVVLPTAVGIWWYRSIKYSADQVLMDTTRLYLQLFHRTAFMNTKKLLTVLGGSFEFWKQYNKEIIERPSDDEEVPRLMKQLPRFEHTRKEKPACLCFPYSIKARALLHAHLTRMQLPFNTIEQDRQYILRKSPLLIQEMIQVYNQLVWLFQTNRAQRMPSLETLDNVFKLFPMIVQSCWDNKSPLYQLPHFTEETIRHCVHKKRYVKSCADLAHLADEERQSLLRSLSKREYQDVLNVLSMMPHVEMNVRVEVQDEDDKQTVTAGSVVTVFVSLKRTPLMDAASLKSVSSTNAAGAANEDEQDSVENGQAAEVSEGEAGDQAEETEQNVAANQKKRPVWEKQKKGKKAGKKKKHAPTVQQKQVAAAASKPATQQATVTEDADEKVVQASPRRKLKPKEKKEEESGGESSEEEDDAPIDEHLNHPDADDDEDDFLLDDMGPKDKILEAKSKITHPVHCPYFPEEKYEWYWVYICDRKRRVLICPPVSVTTLVKEEEVQLRFQAPKKGTYTYQVCLRCDSYLDVDLNKDIKIQVQEAKEIVSHPQWNFPSEDEEEQKSEHSEAALEYTEEEEEHEDDNSD